MATIEERAKSILLQSTKQPTAIDLYSRDEVLEMLVKIATEQKKIDIDRAYSWLVHNLDDDRAFVVWRDFKKFMMEE